MNKSILIQRTLWYVSGSTTVTRVRHNGPNTFLHPDDDLYKDRLVNKHTRDKVISFMRSKGIPILNEYVGSLDAKINSLQGMLGATTGSLWRTYPSCKVNSFYDDLCPNKLGPDTIDRIKSYYEIEKLRVNKFQEEYQKVCLNVFDKGGNMNMPDPELHKYMNTFPETFEEFLKDRSKYIVDQLYMAILNLDTNKSIIYGSNPDIVMKDDIDPDLNIVFNRKSLEDDWYAITLYSDKDILIGEQLFNNKNKRKEEFIFMFRVLLSMIAWGCNYKTFYFDKVEEVKDYIESTKTPSINNIFELTIDDFKL